MLRRQSPDTDLRVESDLVVTFEALFVALGSREHIALVIDRNVGDLAAGMVFAGLDVHAAMTVGAAWVAQDRHHGRK